MNFFNTMLYKICCENSNDWKISCVLPFVLFCCFDRKISLRIFDVELLVQFKQNVHALYGPFIFHVAKNTWCHNSCVELFLLHSPQQPNFSFSKSYRYFFTRYVIKFNLNLLYAVNVRMIMGSIELWCLEFALLQNINVLM